ncbi:hypothetical protein FRC10_000438 [Ceratobasidium sp. 414]|nr:hypothetical protein FRC10_000438 [Ceratobasidium sp. 414]
MWSKPPAQRELSREQWLRECGIACKDVLGAGAQLARHSEETREPALNILRLVLSQSPVMPQVSCQMIDEGKHIEETSAGQALGKEFQDYIERLKAGHKRAQKKLRIEQQEKVYVER